MYTLRFPFRLPPGRAIGADEVSRMVGGTHISVKSHDGLHVLMANGLASEQAAEDLIAKCRSGFAWLLLSRGIAAEYSLDLQKPSYAAAPHQAAENLTKSFGVHIDGPVDGLIDGSRPAIYLTEKVMRVATAGAANLVLTTPSQQVIDLLAEGISFPNSGAFAEDVKLGVALDLFGAYFSEGSDNSRFLTLIMALEALAVGAPRTPMVVEMLERWHVEATSMLEALPPESEDAISLDAVTRELLIRREDSIRKQIRNLVRASLEEAADANAEGLARSAVRLYDLRSRLVHDGVLDRGVLCRATADARVIVESVLKSRFESLTRREQARSRTA